MKFYLDTSVIVKWYKEKEEYEKQALSLLDKVVRFEIISCTSSLSKIELGRALQKINAPREEIQECLYNLDSLMHTSIARSEISDKCVNLATDIVLRLGMGVFDAIHLSSSVLENCTTVVTADEKHMLKRKVVDFFNETYHIRIVHIKDIK